MTPEERVRLPWRDVLEAAEQRAEEWQEIAKEMAETLREVREVVAVDAPSVYSLARRRRRLDALARYDEMAK